MKSTKMVVLLTALVGFIIGVAPARATPLQGNVGLDLTGQGLNVAEGGVGLEHLGNGTAIISVDIGGPVEKALLYWAGRDKPCPEVGGSCVVTQPYKDQELLFDGNFITGDLIGEEINDVYGGTKTNNIAYRADVTGIVRAAGTGVQSFTVADGDLASNLWRLNGAGLLVVYTDESDPGFYRLVGADGLDFAYHPATPAAAKVTEPITLAYAAAGQERVAELIIFAGDPEADRPDRVDISDNPSEVDQLNGSDGHSWDSDVFDITIPAGVGATTVQVVSPTEFRNSDSLLWTLGALRIPIPVPESLCRVTGGGSDCADFLTPETECFMPSGLAKKHEQLDVYTFGGQCGAPGSPFGEWTHANHDGPSGRWTFHAGTHSAPENTLLEVVQCMDPTACHPAAANGLNKQIVCQGVGTFKNGDPPMGAANGLHAVRIRIVDSGEPGMSGRQGAPDGCPADGFENATADCDCPDYYHITIHETSNPGSAIIYEVRGYIATGNLQMHESLD